MGHVAALHRLGIRASSPMFIPWINLFNLLAVWQLDGSRESRALTQSQGFVVVAAIGASWFWTEESLLFILLVFALWRAWRSTEEAGDTTALAQFVILVVALIEPIDGSPAIESSLE